MSEVLSSFVTYTENGFQTYTYETGPTEHQLFQVMIEEAATGLIVDQKRTVVVVNTQSALFQEYQTTAARGYMLEQKTPSIALFMDERLPYDWIVRHETPTLRFETYGVLMRITQAYGEGLKTTRQIHGLLSDRHLALLDQVARWLGSEAQLIALGTALQDMLAFHQKTDRYFDRLLRHVRVDLDQQSGAFVVGTPNVVKGEGQTLHKLVPQDATGSVPPPSGIAASGFDTDIANTGSRPPLIDDFMFPYKQNSGLV